MAMAESPKRVAIITGAARGIGNAIAIRLYKDGLALVVSDLEGSIHLLEQQFLGHDDILIKSCDVRDDNAVRELVKAGMDRFKRVDVMVANAGIGKVESIERMEIDDVKKVLATNFLGVFSSLKYAAQAIKAGGRGGRLIAAASVAAKEGAALHGAYCASKFAVRGLVQCVAAEYGPFGITVNAYAPGPIDTQLLATMAREFASEVPGADKGTYVAEAIQRMPLGRIGQPHEVAGLVSYLVSDEAKFITGQSIGIDGGYYMD